MTLAAAAADRRPFFVAFVVMVLGISAITSLLFLIKTPETKADKSTEVRTPVFVPESDDKRPLVMPKTKKVVTPIMPVVPALPQPRRLPVGGAEGFFVVFMPDGTSYLETPDGKKQQLVDAAFAKKPTPDELINKINARLIRPAEVKNKTVVGQLVVLDKGVVDIPKGAQITLIESSRLVVLNDDGTSTVYHADGKTELRQRPKVKQDKPEKKEK